jgi:hypothetical protein
MMPISRRMSCQVLPSRVMVIILSPLPIFGFVVGCHFTPPCMASL